MQVKLVVFPSDNELNVVIWGKWTEGSMRVRQFATRTELIEVLRLLGLLGPDDAICIERCTFEDSCPLFTGEVDEEILSAHGFKTP